MKELGYDVEYYLWIAMFAPRNTPAHPMKVLREAVGKAMQEPDVKAAMDKIQVPIAYQDAPEFTTWFEQDARRLAEAIKRIGKIETK
jgi:tripartite-type tricarboxylate transporter receptor subunit TctC